MLTERTDFAAIELPLAGGLQGALIVGGNPGGATTPNAEIFVPQSGPTPAAFRAIKGTTPSLPRFRHTLHALPGG
ncbi:hypothetical protein ACP3W1_25550, partial [Salmonella enterica]|uniref:hypothetical protein n=1 Tax=Salmonella enterica TaxID=28901 RepID=UPI003CF8F3DA